MKKIAIITPYDDINFGNKIQNYAVQRYFSLLGYDACTIPYYEQAHVYLTPAELVKTVTALRGL